MQPFDIFMIFLLVVVIGLIIGLNIVSVIDKKIGNIEINIPPIKPTVIVKVIKGEDMGNDKYDIYMESDQNKNNKLEKPHIEGFTDVTAPTTSTVTIQPNQLIKNNKGHGNIENPDGQDIVDYGGYVCYKKDNTVQEEHGKIEKQIDKLKLNSVQPIPSICGNNSLVNIHSHGSQQLAPFDVQGLHNNENPDPAEYYKKYTPMVSHLEDEYLKGYNIADTTKNARINEVGVIRLDDAGIYPTPNNYYTKPITQKQPKYDQL
jgi:hypothetical protein